jgi:cysteine desulfurase
MQYFDHAASTILYPEVIDFLSKSFKEDYANPNAKHLFGSNLLKAIEIERAYFLKALNASPNDTFIFTSSATESNNTVIRGFDFNEGDVILYSKADHPSLTEPAENIAKEKKLILKNIKLNKTGNIDLEEFERLLDGNVKMVLLSQVNNQSGVVSDINLIAKLIKNKSAAHVHVDAVQAYSKINCDVSVNIDSTSITSHKIGGPRGIAGLFLKKNHKIKPLLLGGGQESGFRASTQSHSLIIAFAKASRISFSKRDISFIKMQTINETIKMSLTKLTPAIKFPFNHSSPYILTFISQGIPSDVLLRHLEVHGFCLSSTSACSSKQRGYNSTLAALNIPEIFHKNVVRLSFNHDTSFESVTHLVTAFTEVWKTLEFLATKKYV